MGIRHKSYLGYGFKIDKKIMEGFLDAEFNECKNEIIKELYKTKKYEVIDHGYCDEDPEGFICIKKSVFEVYQYDNAKKLSVEKLKIEDNWDELLLHFSKKLGIKKSKPSWVLCCFSI